MASKVSLLLESRTTLVADERSVLGHVDTDVRKQESASLVGVGAVDPLAVWVDERAGDVLVREVQLQISLVRLQNSIGYGTLAYPEESGAIEAREGFGATNPVAGLGSRSGSLRDRVDHSTRDSVVDGSNGCFGILRGGNGASREVIDSHTGVRDGGAVNGQGLHVETRRKRAIQRTETGNCNSKLLFLGHLRGKTGADSAVVGGIVLYKCQRMSMVEK